MTAKKTTTPKPKTTTVPVNPLSNPKAGQVTPATINAPYLWQQPPFDERIRQLSQPFASDFDVVNGTSQQTGIQRGFMAWDPNTPWVAPYNANQSWAGAPKVLFLYNPSTIEATYSTDNAGANASMVYPVSNTSTNLIVPLQQTVGFTIMFDRTYELNGAVPGSQMAQLGVETDILAMKQITGMFSTAQEVSGSSGGNPYQGTSSSAGNLQGLSASLNNANPNSGAVLQGIMTMCLTYVFFATPVSGLTYYGLITEFDVQYTHFAQSMVPMRAVVDVSMQLLPPPSLTQTVNVSQAAATTSAQQLSQQQLNSSIAGQQNLFP